MFVPMYPHWLLCIHREGAVMKWNATRVTPSFVDQRHSWNTVDYLLDPTVAKSHFTSNSAHHCTKLLKLFEHTKDITMYVVGNISPRFNCISEAKASKLLGNLVVVFYLLSIQVLLWRWQLAAFSWMDQHDQFEWWVLKK